MVLLRFLSKLFAGEAGRAAETEADAAAEQARRVQRFDARLAEMLAQHPAGPPPNPETGASIGATEPAGLQSGSIRRAGDVLAIDSARRRPILFRQLYPPPLSPGRSFYGGVPIGPRDMQWPCNPRDGRPMSFVMQWDARALAAEDATGLLPNGGILYLFSNLAWGEELVFRFLHVDDGEAGVPLPVPDTLPPAFGDEGALLPPMGSTRIPPGRRDPPRLLPCWPFEPVGIDFPAPATDDEDSDGGRFWNESAEVKEVVLRAQDPSATATETEEASTPKFGRPFPGFPQDWAAVRVTAVAALNGLDRISDAQWRRHAPQADAEKRKALTESWRQLSLALHDEALENPPGGALPQQRADQIWHRIEALAPAFGYSFHGAVDEAVNLSLGLGSDGIGAIPAERIEALASRHALATARIRDEYRHEFQQSRGLGPGLGEVEGPYKQAQEAGELKRIRDVWAPVPNRMFGPPSFVQGDVEELLGEWLLLLELSDSQSIGLHFGDGVLQFLIRPDDLAALRFDKVQVICTGY